MTTPLLDRSFETTLDGLVAEYSQQPGVQLDVWVFADAATRRAAEARLAEAGVAACIRSAFKPLLHFFLEEAEPGFAAAQVAYPVHPAAPANRYLVEAYPLAGSYNFV